MSHEKESKIERWKPTQGQAKVLAYLEDLIRNKAFLKDYKRLRSFTKKAYPILKQYNSGSVLERRDVDGFLKELDEIIDGYELLKRRAKKLFKTQDFRLKEKLAYRYGIDDELLWLVEAMLAGDEDDIKSASGAWRDPLDMCRVMDLYGDCVLYNNKGDDFVHISPARQLFYISHPVAICMNMKASKRDVLDFIEKRWDWIDGIRKEFYKDKALKIKKRKHSQSLIDFIWENRALSAKAIKQKMKLSFPDAQLAYYEITKLISLEKKRRGKVIKRGSLNSYLGE